jgi:hypothetical protein
VPAGLPQPPPTVILPAEELPAGGTAWGTLVTRRAAEAADSQVATDIGWLLDLGRRHLAPDSEPEGRRRTVERALRVNAWWFGQGRGSPRQRVLVRDPDGIILTYKRGRGFLVNPVATTGRWQDLNDEYPPEALAEPLLQMAVARRGAGVAFLAWEYFDVADDPTAIRPGVSAMAQGRVAETMANAFRRTGDIRFARAAFGAVEAFAVPVDAGGVVSRVAEPGVAESWPWYVERAYPGDDPWKGAALNGFMVTLISLRSVAANLVAGPPAGLPSAPPAPDPETLAAAERAAAEARSLADRGAATLTRFLPLHDTGAWSYYGLLTPGKPWRTYLADLNYHCYHVLLLSRLDLLFPDQGYGRVGGRWDGYVTRSGQACPER